MAITNSEFDLDKLMVAYRCIKFLQQGFGKTRVCDGDHGLQCMPKTAQVFFL